MATMTDHLKKISLDAEAVVSATLALSRRGREGDGTAVTSEPTRAITHKDQDLVRELAAAQAIIRDHEAKVGEWKKKVEDAEEAQKVAGISFQKMRKDSEIFQIQYKKMEADLEVMKAEKLAAEQKAEDAEKGHGLREQVDSLRAELKVAKEQLKEVVPASQHDIVVGELKQVKEKLTETENELTQAKQKVNALTAEKEDLDRKFGLVRETGKKLEEQNKKRKEQNQALLKEKDNLQQELNVLKARPDSAVRVEGGAEASSSEVESLKAQISQLQAELQQEQSKQPGTAEPSSIEIEKIKETFKQDEKRLQEEIQSLKQKLEDEKQNYNKAKNLAHTLTQKLKKFQTPAAKPDQEKKAELVTEVVAAQPPAVNAAKTTIVGTVKVGTAAAPVTKPTPQGAQIAKILGMGNKQPGPGGQAGKQAPAGQAKVGAISKVNDDSACQNNQMQGQKKAPGQHAAVNSFSFPAMRDLIVPYCQAGQTPKQSPAAQQAGGSPGKVQLNKAPPAATAAKTASPPQPTDAQPPTAATGAAKPQAGGAHVASSAENLLRQKLLQAQQQKKNAAAATEAKQDAAPDAAEATAGKRLRSTVEESEAKSGNEGDTGSAGDTPGEQDESKRARRIISLKKK
ncbi:hypothetical protein GUITHDRAFT_101505 [Guillardia theta CCMP2712]|uniref:Uncharacterized protein n=1 Tax=Guillardia theta (strain CCMP2712) TaxID=905079 RepID=L1JXI6_GUITC|nr:hypothetical protein GUITHDRAFT_101505 [Guillardia theta CCMP2712]EKX53059.1 hypothetical protein GUITHDRAFT_101505 [Guillardia theta CCMP2712]|eukprot:XP_005840039.1 hypothetical protein GUITHDRAFT_101505 [Guillardia theta CCMP2712]